VRNFDWLSFTPPLVAFSGPSPIHGSIPGFSPEPTNEAGGVIQAPVGDQLLGLPDPYHRHTTVRSILTRGANPSVLNRHRRGLQPWKCRLTTYHSPTFPTSCLHFPLRVPPGLQFNQVPSTKPKC
jgi:hypothetical protein